MRNMAQRIRDQQCRGLQYKDGRLTRCRLTHLHDGVCDFTPLPVVPPARHTTDKPCLACRSLVKGDEQHANELWCDPDDDGCGHFHPKGHCPEIMDYNGPSERQIEAMYDRPSLAEQMQTQFTIQDRLK